jgi:hypothetical protein
MEFFFVETVRFVYHGLLSFKLPSENLTCFGIKWGLRLLLSEWLVKFMKCESCVCLRPKYIVQISIKKIVQICDEQLLWFSLELD